MNYLVFLDSQASELEKILSGTKSMLVKEFDPARAADQPVRPGDKLYFLKKNGERVLRVKATVVRVLSFINLENEDRSNILKEMQPRLHLTEDQYNHWSAKQQFLLVEFDYAHKIDPIQIPSNLVTDRSDWIDFEKISLITS